AEDLGWGDVTTDNLVPSSAMARAAVVYRTAGIVCGIPVLTRVFQTIDPDVTVEALIPEGERVEKGATAAIVRGAARAILKGERVALNFVQRMAAPRTMAAVARSEEHTSELQSLAYLVCRLLLEKKKK